jgi:hypothetical protein
MTVPGPFPPFDTWPLQRVDARYGYAWYLPPTTIVDQIVVEHATVETVQALHDDIDALLARARVRIEGEGGALIFGDWRRLRSYTPEARRLFLERVRARPKTLMRTGVTVLARVSPILRMAVQAGGMMLAVAGRAKVEVYDDIDEALRAHGVGPRRGAASAVR